MPRGIAKPRGERKEENTMTRRKIKTSLGIKIASIVACLALTAVGFASWLIIKPAEPVETTGSFEVYTVEDNDVTITLVSSENTAIKFGKPASSSVNNPWLYAGTDVQNEVLTATFNVKVESKAGSEAGVDLAEILSNFVVDFEIVDNAGNAYAAATTNGYIGHTTVKIDGASAAADAMEVTTKKAFDENKASQDFVVTVEFSWGGDFTKTEETTPSNPYDYFNSFAYSTEKATEADAALSGIAAISDVTFKLTFSTEGNA